MGETPNFNAGLSSWDTSGVTTMRAMFRRASAFNQPLSLDTSSVTDMRNMFGGASAFNQPLSLDTWEVTGMSFMFNRALAFNQPLSFNTSKVTDMSSMFAGYIYSYLWFAGVVGVQPAAQLRHVQGHEHGQHVPGELGPAHLVGVGKLRLAQLCVQSAAQLRHVHVMVIRCCAWEDSSAFISAVVMVRARTIGDGVRE